jgi:hypothetical protein
VLNFESIRQQRLDSIGDLKLPAQAADFHSFGLNFQDFRWAIFYCVLILLTSTVRKNV